MFIEYRPTKYIAKRLLGIIYIFHVPVIKKYVSIPDMWKSKTLGKQSVSDIVTTSVFNCQLSTVGQLMAIKNSVFYYFWSTFVDNIDVFDCRLSGVNSMLRWTFLHIIE